VRESLVPRCHASDNFTFSNPPGPHAVGVKIVQQYDRSRLYKKQIDLATGEPAQGERTRPMQTLIWYPAARGGQPVTYRQYLETMATEDEFARNAAEVKSMTDGRIDSNAGARRDALLREIARPMLAVRDARAESGKFPVVIYAPSFSAPAVENTDLCEYLASQGYIVLSQRLDRTAYALDDGRSRWRGNAGGRHLLPDRLREHAVAGRHQQGGGRRL
jgi:hypothetical protein